jgi:hypothetical protein
MTEAAVTEWLQRMSPIWTALVLGLVPALIAGYKRRAPMRWYLYGVACALVTWPLAALPMIHALLLRRRSGVPDKVRQQRRRADALALVAEDSVRSYPSWIAELKGKSPGGIDRRRYAYAHIAPGEALELVRGHADASKDRAVAYYHRGVHLGYVPSRHRWIAEALDDGLRLAAIAERVKVGWIFRRRARFVGTRIIVVSEGR